MGPVTPPYTGQAIAFTTVANYYKRRDDYKLFVVDLANKNGILKGILLNIKISVLLLMNEIDVVYFTCSRSFLGSIRDVVLLFWTRLFKIKTINHLHGGDFLIFYRNSPALYKRILRWCYKKVNTSIVLIKGMETLFSDFPEMQVKIVSNSYDSLLDNFPLVKKQNRYALKMLYLSNIMETKGILDLLDAFEIVLGKHLECQLTIAGSYMSDYISSEQEIRQKFQSKYSILKEKYCDRINYIATVEGEKKNNLLWNSDVFILPTFHKTEAFPISILEALRAGNYIVTTKHNYLPSIVSLDNGELIVPNSTKALVQAIQNIICNIEKLNEIQNYNIQYAISNYKEDKYIKGVTQIVNENLSNNSHL